MAYTFVVLTFTFNAALDMEANNSLNFQKQLTWLTALNIGHESYSRK